MSDKSDDTGEDKTVDEILASVRNLVMDGSGSGSVSVAEGDSGDDSGKVIELTRMVRAPDGYASVSDFQERNRVGSDDGSGGVDSMVDVSDVSSSHATVSSGEDGADDSSDMNKGVDDLDITGDVKESLSGLRAASDISGLTVEQLVADSVRPIIRDWLSEHLPNLVNRAVEVEVKRLLTLGFAEALAKSGSSVSMDSSESED